jgi:hypothetical protein
VADVVLLHLLLEPARRHVVDHALTQRTAELALSRKLLSRMGLNPTILRQAQTFALFLRLQSIQPPLPRERFRSRVESGPIPSKR